MPRYMTVPGENGEAATICRACYNINVPGEYPPETLQNTLSAFQIQPAQKTAVRTLVKGFNMGAEEMTDT